MFLQLLHFVSLEDKLSMSYIGEDSNQNTWPDPLWRWIDRPKPARESWHGHFYGQGDSSNTHICNCQADYQVHGAFAYPLLKQVKNDGEGVDCCCSHTHDGKYHKPANALVRGKCGQWFSNCNVFLRFHFLSIAGFLVDHHHPINDVQESGFLCASPKENHTMIICLLWRYSL